MCEHLGRCSVPSAYNTSAGSAAHSHHDLNERMRRGRGNWISRPPDLNRGNGKHQSDRNQATGRKLQVEKLDPGADLRCLTSHRQSFLHTANPNSRSKELKLEMRSSWALLVCCCSRRLCQLRCVIRTRAGARPSGVFRVVACCDKVSFVLGELRVVLGLSCLIHNVGRCGSRRHWHHRSLHGRSLGRRIRITRYATHWIRHHWRRAGGLVHVMRRPLFSALVVR